VAQMQSGNAPVTPNLTTLIAALPHKGKILAQRAASRPIVDIPPPMAVPPTRTLNAEPSGSITILPDSLLSRYCTVKGGSLLNFPINRSITDGVIATNTSLVSATANFTSADISCIVTGTGIPYGTTISSVTNSTTVVLNQSTTATASGVAVTITGKALRNYVQYIPTTTSVGAAPYYVDFEMYGRDVAFRFNDNQGGTVAKIWLWVDGIPVTQYLESTGSDNPGQLARWYVDFGTVGRRRIRAFFHNCDFAGFRINPTTALLPANHVEEKIAIFGDSWVQGGNNNVVAQHTLWYTAALMNDLEPFSCGQSGTGYQTPTGNPNFGIYGDQRRIDALVAANPDYVLIAGSVNDDVNTPVNAATITANATAVYAALRLALPNAKLIVAGVQSVGGVATGDLSADRITNNNAVKAAALAATNVIGFIDHIADRWFTGTGDTASPTGDGTRDVMFTGTYHLSAIGHDITAYRCARALNAVLMAA